MAYQAYNITTGEVINEDDVVTDFRGDEHVFQYATRANQPGKDGKVCVGNSVLEAHEYYASVFNLAVCEV